MKFNEQRFDIWKEELEISFFYEENSILTLKIKKKKKLQILRFLLTYFYKMNLQKWIIRKSVVSENHSKSRFLNIEYKFHHIILYNFY